MIANIQAQSCKDAILSDPANSSPMSEADKDLIDGLVAHTGEKATAIARRAGLTPSTLTRPQNNPVKHRLSTPTLEKLQSAVPDYPGWSSYVAAKPRSNAKVLAFEGDNLDQPEENLPVWGSGLGAERMFEGEAVEQTDLNTGAQLDYVRRPAILKGKKGAYALHVQGSSMHPALPEGELVVACRDMPLSMGDNVVVYLRDGDQDDGERARAVLVKELVRRSASYVELRQYDPRIDFRVAMSEVLRIDRILTRREMVS